MKLDVLIISVHPDDAELGCGGTILKQIALGQKVGIVDLTRGELGTRGTAQTREEEAANAAKILGLSVRENLGMRDGFFEINEQHKLQVITAIRKYRPEIVITNAYHDRHPDHGRACDLVYDSVFLAGLKKITTTQDEGEEQAEWRPKLLLHFIQDQYIKPDIIVDIGEHWDAKMESVLAYKTQFYNPASDEGATYISSPEFLKIVEARAREFGKSIGASFGEGFTCRRLLGVTDLSQLR